MPTRWLVFVCANPGRWVIFVDSNVWYLRTLRDWLGMLYVTPEAPRFHVQWTDDVLAELLYHLGKRHPPLVLRQDLGHSRPDCGNVRDRTGEGL